MTIEEEFRLSCYEELRTLSENTSGSGIKKDITLVRHVENGELYVKKVLGIYNKDIYSRLQMLNLKSIPHIYECVEDDDKLIVIEEYIDGFSLRSFMESKGLLGENETVDIITKLCDIMIILHGQEPAIIHRDIKPDNIMITRSGEVKLIDFNATKERIPGQTEDTVLMGTRHYAAPEQYGFFSSDERADIYAIGVMMNEMLTGKMPNITLAGGFLGEIIKKCTKMDRDNRYQSVDSLKRALLGEKSSDVSVNIGNETGAKVHPNRLVGFRSGNISYMIIAVLGYMLIAWVCFSLNFTGDNGENILGIRLLVHRIIYFVWIMGEVLILFNYRDINKKNKNTVAGFVIRTIRNFLLYFILVVIVLMIATNLLGVRLV